MKLVKRLSCLFLAIVMVMAMGITAFAQEVNSGKGGSASITITNAANGETYKVYKLFDATVTGTKDGSIAYTGEIPTSLSAYFTKDSAGNISAVAGVSETDRTAALKAWAATQTETANATSDGTELKFTNLQYGYYVVTSTQGNGANITVTSTNPNASIVDKNQTPPLDDLTKTVDDDDVKIGDTATYTVKFKTANYEGEGSAAKQITDYIIKDTLPEFLTNVTVTKITIGGTEYKVNDAVPQFTNKTITIPWVGDNGESLYANGAEVVITYTATVTEKAAIDGQGNKNTVSVTYKTSDGEKTPDKNTADEVIYTYAIAIKKVSDKGANLAGAEFTLPFYVKSAADTDGAYIYAGTVEGEGLTNKLTTPASGLLIIKGVEKGDYSITESKAPDGYNKLTSAVTAEAVATGKTTTSVTKYIDADGNVTDTETDTKVEVIDNNIAATPVIVVNKTGSELPTTGGMGTTLLYVGGIALILGAGVVMIVRKRMA